MIEMVNSMMKTSPTWISSIGLMIFQPVPIRQGFTGRRPNSATNHPLWRMTQQHPFARVATTWSTLSPFRFAKAHLHFRCGATLMILSQTRQSSNWIRELQISSSLPRCASTTSSFVFLSVTSITCGAAIRDTTASTILNNVVEIFTVSFLGLTSTLLKTSPWSIWSNSSTSQWLSSQSYFFASTGGIKAKSTASLNGTIPHKTISASWSKISPFSFIKMVKMIDSSMKPDWKFFLR